MTKMFFLKLLRPSILAFALAINYSLLFLSQAIIPEVTSQNGGHSLVYIASQKYFIFPDGLQIRDDRSEGSLYPNMFDVIRKDSYGEHIVTEHQDDGCNLEELFRTTIFNSSGFHARKYLNALAATSRSCQGLSTSEEKALCDGFLSKSACVGAMPIALRALPLTAGATYLSYKVPFTCESVSEMLLKETYIPEESLEWQKIGKDITEKKRSEYQKTLKAKVPYDSLKSKVLATNAYATQRDFDFAASEWIYNEARKYQPEVSKSEIQPVAEKRYSPHGAIFNLISFKSEIGGNCKGLEKRYQNKIYAEAQNIPPQYLLLFDDFVNISNHCLCK
ncbi:MAG: hypothetical protein SFT81_02700 [Candidatus Caenarcaniphilales bacterium]|nr:hypothetical protein [Candidatus Caenarcaniphilales bacterium]